MPVTRVIDAKGNVLHDCIALGCTVSWDGYALKDQTTPSPGLPSAVAVKAGQRVTGAAAPDPSVWRVTGNTAQAIE